MRQRERGVLRFSRSRHRVPLGKLISAAQKIPAERLLEATHTTLSCLAAVPLMAPLAPDEIRDLVILGALITRLLFDELEIPRDTSWPL